MKTIYTICIILLLGVSNLGIPELLYSKYLTFAVFLFFGIETKWRIDKQAFKSSSPLFPFLLLLLFYVLWIWNFNHFLLIDFIIILGAILPFIFAKKIDVNLKVINIFLLIIFFLSNGLSFKIDLSTEAFLLSETSEAESNILPFLFGLLAIFFFSRKNYMYTILNLILVMLSFKRIVFLAVCICLVFQFFKMYKFKYITLSLVFCNLLWVYISYFITTDFARDICQELTGLPIGQFTQGRSARYGFVWDFFMKLPLKYSLWGIGGGQTRLLLSQLFDGISLQLHNDIMKIFVDFGIFILLLFSFFLYRNKREFMALTVFLNIVFLTDNVLIYEPVIFLYFLLSYEILKNKEVKLCQISAKVH